MNITPELLSESSASKSGRFSPVTENAYVGMSEHVYACVMLRIYSGLCQYYGRGFFCRKFFKERIFDYVRESIYRPQPC